MLYIRETYINETKGYQFGDANWFEAWTDDLGKLFKSLQKEYGRCVSKMYRDREGKPPLQVGWVFQKTMEYEDNFRRGKRDTYTREVWVEVSSVEPVKSWEYSTPPCPPFAD